MPNPEDSHLPLERLEPNTELSEADHAHLAGCPRCRIEQRRLKRAHQRVSQRENYAHTTAEQLSHRRFGSTARVDRAHVKAQRAFAVRVLKERGSEETLTGPLVPVLPRAGDQVRGYELLEEVGRGGFGVVFRARQPSIDADVAVKFLIPSTGRMPSQVLERFALEAAIMRQLEHPAAVKIRDSGTTPEGIPFIVSEFIRGTPLAGVIAAGGLGEARTAHVAHQILGCLAEAHQRGVVHRDLKPGNIMVRDILGEEDNVKVLDFGVARVTESEINTHTGAFIGTPWYMSPEQTRGIKEIDGRADLYALGLIMAECLDGERVVKPDLPMAAMHVHYNDVPLTFNERVQTSRLFCVIERATAKEREARYTSAGEMREALRTASRGTAAPEGTPAKRTPAVEPVAASSARPRVTVLVAAIAAAVVLTLVVVALVELQKNSEESNGLADAGSEHEMSATADGGVGIGASEARDESPPQTFVKSSEALPTDIVRWRCYQGHGGPQDSWDTVVLKRVLDPQLREITERWFWDDGWSSIITLSVFEDGSFHAVGDRVSGAGRYVGEALSWQSWDWSWRVDGQTITVSYHFSADQLLQTTRIASTGRDSSTADETSLEVELSLVEVDCEVWDEGRLNAAESVLEGSGVEAVGIEGDSETEMLTAYRELTRFEPVASGVLASPDLPSSTAFRQTAPMVIDTHRSELVYCYEQRRDREAEGRVVLEVVVERTGQVVEATIAESDLAEESVHNCIIEQLRHWQFPNEGDDVVRFTYPLVFSL